MPSPPVSSPAQAKGSSQARQQTHASEPQPSTSQSAEEGAKGECPICTLMREGGCEQQFHSFMDCGTDAERGQREYTECIKAFEVMRACMESNPAVFAPLLTPLEESTNTMEKPKDEAQTGGKKAAG